jgi:hypothetical protein
MAKRIRILLMLGALIGGFGPEVVGPYLPASVNGFVANVEAIIGRPLTPLSVAGVARRTARRCAVGVYSC